MAQFDNITVTRAGRAYMAESLAESKALAFDHIAVGDGTAPEAPEDLTELVHLIADVPISKITDDGGGIVSIRGNFVAIGATGGFSFREAGVYVKAWRDGDPPVLFAYCNAGDHPDYIPPVGDTSIMEESLIFSIVIGGATVLYNNIDPTARATIQDVADLETELKSIIKTLSDELSETKKELDAAKDSIKDLTEKSEDYVMWTDYATKDKAGIVQIGANLSVDTEGKVSVPVATNSTLGVSRPGNGMSVSNGELTYWLNGHQEDFILKSENGSSIFEMSANTVDIQAKTAVKMRETTRNTGFAAMYKNDVGNAGFTINSHANYIGWLDSNKNLMLGQDANLGTHIYMASADVFTNGALKTNASGIVTTN